MPSYLVECYVADRPDAVEDAVRRARLTAQLDADVRYLRTTVVPGDETVLHLFEAPSLEALRSATRRAALAHHRIVAASELSAERH